jgi:hypothetical protein
MWRHKKDKHGVDMRSRAVHWTEEDPPWEQTPPLSKKFIDDYNTRGVQANYCTGMFTYLAFEDCL